MNLYKKIVLIAVLIFTTASYAQEYHINFENQPKWKKILKMAKNQNKMIFVDAYTTWCGPCKMMDRDVFTDKAVSEFFNENFISVKMDMEKGEGITLKTDWNVTAFPTFVYFNPKGEIVHRVVGYHPAPNFMHYSSMALDENKMAANLQKKYDNGDRNGAFMYDYLVSLRLGNYDKLETEVAGKYLASLSEEDLLKKENWNVIKYFMKDPSSTGFQYLVTNKKKLAEIVGEIEVEGKLFKTIDDQIKKWSYWYGDKPFETEKESKLIEFLQASSYENASGLLGKLLINKYKRLQNSDQHINAMDFAVKFNLVGQSSNIVHFANEVMKTYKSESSWAKALMWLNIAEKKETKVEHKAAIFNAKSKLLEKLGNKTEAEIAKLAAEKADKEAEAAGTKIISIPAMKMTGMKPKKN